MSTQSYNIGNEIYDNNNGDQNVIADYAYISDLLANIPDNNTNQIDAKDVRDAVWTLWNRVESLSASFSDTSSIDMRYDRTRASSAASVGGVGMGSTFSGTLQDVFDRIFYPYTPPSCSLSGGGNRQFGANTAVTLNFTLNKFEKPVSAVSITLLSGTTPLTIPSVLTQNNTTTATFVSGPSTTPASVVTYATHSLVPTSTSLSNTYTLTIGDGVGSAQSTTTVTWMNYLYNGTLNLSTLSGNANPDLTVRPDGSNSNAVAASIVQIAASIDSNTIKASTGTYNRVLVSKVLATSRTLSLTDYVAGNNYLFFAWPTIFGTPTFKINGLSNTAFTKVKSNYVFVNENGFSGVNYDVWISNTVYGTATINIS
jgi:carbon monoxide dehydrogenase subunit G